jgi:hypothetical protein
MNLTFDDTFLLKYGSTWPIDSIYLFFITPISMIGFVLNLINMLVITKIRLKTILYKYLLFYCVNSAFICLLGSISSYIYSPRYLGVFSDFFARFYYCVAVQSVASSLYFFSSLLDILINFERLSLFVPKLVKYAKINAYLVITLTLLISIIFNLPTSLRVYVKSDMETIRDIDLSINTSTPFTG